jgi:hypothetical protein
MQFSENGVHVSLLHKYKYRSQREQEFQKPQEHCSFVSTDYNTGARTEPWGNPATSSLDIEN